MSTSPPKKPIQLASPVAYDLWSQSYDKLDNPLLAMVDLAFDRRSLNSMNLRVAELGCGTGRNVSRILASGAKSYHGFDQSLGMLEVARQKHPAHVFAEADIERNIPMADGEVDFILVTLVFEHLSNLTPALRESHRILSPGGCLRILELHSEIARRGTGAHFQNGENEIQLPSFAHDETEWRSAFEAAGWSRLDIVSLRADEEAISRCAKLTKHEGRDVLFDIVAWK